MITTAPIGVVVEGTSPQGGHSHVFVELVAGGDAGHVVVEHGAAGGEAGQFHALNTHAELQVGLRHHPVNVSALHFNHAGAVSAQRAAIAVAGLAPELVADFKVHGAGQGFGGHGVQLQTHALTGFEVVFLVVVAGLALTAGKIAVLAIVKAHDPLAFGLEINGAGAGGNTEHQARRQQKRSDLFHG